MGEARKVVSIVSKQGEEQKGGSSGRQRDKRKVHFVSLMASVISKVRS